MIKKNGLNVYISGTPEQGDSFSPSPQLEKDLGEIKAMSQTPEWQQALVEMHKKYTDSQNKNIPKSGNKVGGMSKKHKLRST